MSVSQAIRYVLGTKSALGALYINCHVKPNARRGSGILSVDEEVVELAVSAQAREGEANKAVVGLLASVSCMLQSEDKNLNTLGSERNDIRDKQNEQS